ncbi:hypothetical protein IC235_15105 [Hymenobacter sp. BT664]|uniref:Lipoprotein n=1 Tax=Hymenobacter montanus TaxID=2771359 RepID=A0A927BFP4_9BACT|nr:hypothetical protein [Hymenobacter montanus]MBD2769218.1 hypothetical protein [Hymenobacter montanus]
MEKRDPYRRNWRWLRTAPLLLLGLSACSGKLDPPSYLAWVQDYSHGLHVQKPEGEYVWDVQYTPTDYVWLQRAGASPGSAATEVRREIDQLQYFTVTVGLQDAAANFMTYRAGTTAEKQERLYYFSYQFQNDIHLEEGGQRLPCVLYHFEQYATRSANSRTFVVGFENNGSQARQASLVIDSPRFGAAPLTITVSKDNLPALQL